MKKRAKKVAHNRPRPFYFTVQPRPQPRIDFSYYEISGPDICSLICDFFCIFREDILAFLTGQEEIETTAHNLRTVLQATDRPCPKGIVVPLYAAQQVSVQQKVFAPTKEGCRKIILSTNIAETSLTIPGVKHVIDSCRVKAK